ncbi:hypothetical protein PAXINDRAFT_154861 [Paxillus involutus ATCC 200175]|nr:hypothetical protein PAXINDRAFT_154861 [Paxillus involutus ATCC 200175]
MSTSDPQHGSVEYLLHAVKSKSIGGQHFSTSGDDIARGVWVVNESVSLVFDFMNQREDTDQTLYDAFKEGQPPWACQANAQHTRNGERNEANFWGMGESASAVRPCETVAQWLPWYLHGVESISWYRSSQPRSCGQAEGPSPEDVKVDERYGGSSRVTTRGHQNIMRDRRKAEDGIVE